MQQPISISGTENTLKINTILTGAKVLTNKSKNLSSWFLPLERTPLAAHPYTGICWWVLFLALLTVDLAGESL
jgi:putative exporter of polyketide antibiotics